MMIVYELFPSFESSNVDFGTEGWTEPIGSQGEFIFQCRSYDTSSVEALLEIVINIIRTDHNEVRFRFTDVINSDLYNVCFWDRIWIWSRLLGRKARTEDLELVDFYTCNDPEICSHPIPSC
jgi:hypothetical protein